jgi:hypothetical protein
MKHLMIPLLLAASFIALSTMEAGAVVCARGVIRAGCVAAGGGVAVVRAPVVRPAGAVVCAAGSRSSAQGILIFRDASECPVINKRQRPMLRSGERA